MKTIVLYSSRTGNTKKIAMAIKEVLPAGTECLSVDAKPENLDAYDSVFLGFWVDRGSADGATQDVLQSLTCPKIALFATLGADPDSDHGRKSMENAMKLVPPHIAVSGTFICQGAVDPRVIEMMYKRFPAGHPHGPSKERNALHERASSHPDDTDCQNAQAFARKMINLWEDEG